MKKYNYSKEVMFYLGDNEIYNFCSNIEENFENDLGYKVNCYIKENDKSIKIISNKDDNSIILYFIYDDLLFNNCYKFEGIYEANKYISTKPLITKLIKFISNTYLIIDVKEPLLCNNCGEQIGWIVNYNTNGEQSICSCGYDDDKTLYDFYDGIFQCDICGEFYCSDCRDYNEYDSCFICDNCLENDFNNYLKNECDDKCYDCIYENKCHYEENTIDEWGHCLFNDNDTKYLQCDTCNKKDKCLSEAEDNRDGYAMFEDCIVGCGYDSMDDFWECNGI